MGKKRIIKKQGGTVNSALRNRALSRTKNKRVSDAILHIQCTYNNTKLLLSDTKGAAIAASSAGALGFKGAKKATPYAGSKVAELVAEKAKIMGVTTISVIVRGVGGGRESAIRTFVGKGFSLESIKDRTPVPHNGPRPKKARRV